MASKPVRTHRRLQWWKWFRCESSFSVLLAPSKPGVFALGEEIVPPGETAATSGKRMLGLFRIAEAEDLGMALGRLFLPGNPEREKLSAGHCFVRYAVIEDAVQRQAAYAALQQWMATSSEAASGVPGEVTAHTFPSVSSQDPRRPTAIRRSPKSSLRPHWRPVFRRRLRHHGTCNKNQ